MDRQQSEQHLAILKQRIYIKRLPSTLNLIDDLLDNASNEQKSFKCSVLTADKRATFLSQRQKMISRFKYDFMTIDMTVVEEIIRSYTDLIGQTKKRLVETANGQVPLPKTLVAVLNAIAARQSNIIQRAQLLTRHKLSFFEQAPAVVVDA